MNIVLSEINNLESILTLTLNQEEDLNPKVEMLLKEYQKKIDMPGFRKGMVPMNIVKRKYELALKFDELNKIIIHTVDNYIKDNQLNLIGSANPIYKETVDFNQKEMNFEFQLGFRPNLSINLSKIEASLYKIKLTEQSIDKTLDKIKKQHATYTTQKKVQKQSEVFVNVIGEREKKHFVLTPEMIKDESLLIGKQLGEIITIKSSDFIHGKESLNNLLKREIHDTIQLKIQKIHLKNSIEFNEELFKKLYPNDSITTLEKLKVKIAKDLESYYQESSMVYFYNQVKQKILDCVDCSLPENFLIQTIKSSEKKEISLEQAREKFENSKNEILFSLIEADLLLNNNIKIPSSELLNFMKNSFLHELKSHGMFNFSEEESSKLLSHVLKDENQIQLYSNRLKRIKLTTLFLEKVKINHEEITIDEFSKIINELITE